MFDEPTEEPDRRSLNPADVAREKSDEFRMHAELCAVFEGCRKFDARIDSKLDPQIARDTQKAIGRLEKSKSADSPALSESSIVDAAQILELFNSRSLSTNDYHIHRRPGEVMILRWLAGEQVDSYYTRLQAHFDAALAAHTDDQRQTHGWKQDARTQAYLKALDAINIKMEERYLRPLIRQHNLFVLSTQSADEMDIFHLCDFIMGVPAAEVVGATSTPPEIDPSDRDRAWFFKLFSLRGMHDGEERMFFFTYLQKSDDF